MDAPLKVFITVDVELWPSSWDNYREEFSESYRRYILGRTPHGSYGLPFQLQMAQDHGLRFVFFVESLFASECGVSALSEVTHMILEAGQEIQAHAHPEWVRHATRPVIATGDRYLMREFDEDEQFRLIDAALSNLADVGVNAVRAFRAGSFAANSDTLSAVSRAGLDIDSSFIMGSAADVGDAIDVEGCARTKGVSEYPLSAFEDWPGHMRPLQLAACSASEMIQVSRRARDSGWDSLVVLSHSAELLDRSRTRPDRLTIRRFERLCRFLADSSSEYVTSRFDHEPARTTVPRNPPPPIRSSRWRTLLRIGEQGVRRLLG